MSPLFSFFLCSHYISFPLPIVNLLFFWFGPLLPLPPSHYFFLFTPSFYLFPLFSPLPSYSTSQFPLPSPSHLFSLYHLCPHHLSIILPPVYLHTSPSTYSASAGCGKWRRVRYWTHWSTTTRQFFICVSPTAWWLPAPRTVLSPSGTWLLLLTSAYVVSLWDTGQLSTWSTLTTNISCQPQGTAPSR